MKKLLLLSSMFLVLTACEKFRDMSGSDVFLKTESGLEYKFSDIELYDSSAYIFYFRGSHDELKEIGKQPFSFFENGEALYSGYFWPAYLNSLPDGPYIWTSPSFYGTYVLKIDYMSNTKPDIRNSYRMIAVLNKRGLLHSGLSITYNSLTINGTSLAFSFTVTNNDQSDLLILDPAKMGINLYHYFTNGLTIRDQDFNEVYSCNIDAASPDPWNSWSPDWLSLLKSGDSKQFTLNYTILTPISPGEYKAYFEFPGLSYQVLKEQLYQGNSRIWLGDIQLIKRITVQ